MSRFLLGIQKNALTKIPSGNHSRWISYNALTIEPTSSSMLPSCPPKDQLKFGTTMSDHMLTIEYKSNQWNAPKILPYQNLSISPAATSLHYALQCFEGMKAYKDVDGDIRLFRPEKNMARLQTSMKRLQMPGCDFDPHQLLRCLDELLRLDRDWIPQGDGYSLYLRPTVIATHPFLGLAAPSELLLYIITSPVGPYYPTGFQPIRLLATHKYVRAWPGGTGANKVGGNYAPTMQPQAEAVQAGYSQVLWLYGEEATEVGGMNIFFVLKDQAGKKTLVTPPLTRGDILPGVTRSSIIELAHTLPDVHVEERFPTMTELQEAAANGNLCEAFGAGTAAVVTPVSGIHYDGNDINIPATGEMTQYFWDTITGIQYGKLKGPEGWSVKI